MVVLRVMHVLGKVEHNHEKSTVNVSKYYISLKVKNKAEELAKFRTNVSFSTIYINF